jgi:hypothetical protein
MYSAYMLKSRWMGKKRACECRNPEVSKRHGSDRAAVGSISQASVTTPPDTYCRTNSRMHSPMIV